MGFFKDIFSMDLKTDCNWLPANHIFFQIANAFLVLTYFVNPSSMGGLLQLRVALTMAALFFGVWGATVICSLDCTLWNIAFAIGNGAHLLYLLFKMRPIAFQPDHDLIFKEIFRPVGVRRFQYKELVTIAKRQVYDCGEFYAKQGVTESNHIGILTSGRFQVSYHNSVINYIEDLEFIDSPEWIATDNTSSTTYQVSLVSTCPSVVYVWQRDDLLKLFKKDSVIKNVFDTLVGRDVCKKLFSVNQKLVTRENEFPKMSKLLHQAPLITYSAGNIFEMCVTPKSSPLKLLHVEKRPLSNSEYSSVSCNSPLLNTDLDEHYNKDINCVMLDYNMNKMVGLKETDI